jgi:hypothetical protein
VANFAVLGWENCFANQRTWQEAGSRTFAAPTSNSDHRQHTLLPLDDCLYALQPTIPHLTRSSLHRCLQRHGISRLPEVKGDKPVRSKFKSYPIGYFHIDIAEVQTAEGKLYLYVAIDRTSKFAFVQVVRKTGRTSASAFLMALIVAVPYKIHTVLTDNVLSAEGNGACSQCHSVRQHALAA